MVCGSSRNVTVEVGIENESLHNRKAFPIRHGRVATSRRARHIARTQNAARHGTRASWSQGKTRMCQAVWHSLPWVLHKVRAVDQGHLRGIYVVDYVAQDHNPCAIRQAQVVPLHFHPHDGVVQCLREGSGHVGEVRSWHDTVRAMTEAATSRRGISSSRA